MGPTDFAMILLLIALSLSGFIIAYFFIGYREEKRQNVRQQEFIDKHLLVVNFPSQHYVLPYVWGTKQKEVFFLLSDPRASKALYEVISTEEATKRITEMHMVHAEEMDRLGI